MSASTLLKIASNMVALGHRDDLTVDQRAAITDADSVRCWVAPENVAAVLD